jgi:hypothetical protein
VELGVKLHNLDRQSLMEDRRAIAGSFLLSCPLHAGRELLAFCSSQGTRPKPNHESHPNHTNRARRARNICRDALRPRQGQLFAGIHSLHR